MTETARSINPSTAASVEMLERELPKHGYVVKATRAGTVIGSTDDNVAVDFEGLRTIRFLVRENEPEDAVLAKFLSAAKNDGPTRKAADPA